MLRHDTAGRDRSDGFCGGAGGAGSTLRGNIAWHRGRGGRRNGGRGGGNPQLRGSQRANGCFDATVVDAQTFRLTTGARLARRRVLAAAVAYIIPGGARTDSGAFLGGEASGLTVQDRGHGQAGENQSGGKTDAELFHTAFFLRR